MTKTQRDAMKVAKAALELAHHNLRDHGDNCFLHDEGEYNSCFCGKDSLTNHLQQVVETLTITLDEPTPQTDHLSVTGILINVVPGEDGVGKEVYAKSVADVENLLTKLSEELEEWQLGIRKLLPQQAVAPLSDDEKYVMIDQVTDKRWSLLDLVNATEAKVRSKMPHDRFLKECNDQ